MDGPLLWAVLGALAGAFLGALTIWLAAVTD